MDKDSGNNLISDGTGTLLSSQYRQYLLNTINCPPAYSSTNSQLSAILKGHHGCVNTLTWSHSGNLLLSGSDDQSLIIHKYNPCTCDGPFTKAKRFQTSHANNIFDAKFNPVSEDKIVSVAADGRVCVVDDWSLRGWDDLNTRTIVASPTSHDAKRIEFIDSNVFLVGCEDGTVVQFDLREETMTRSIKLNLSSQQVGIHSISKCPSAPHLFAVAGTDPFLRFYDLRSIDSQKCLYTWTPPIKNYSRRSNFATGVKFSRFGYTLAANYIKEGPYLIDPVNQTDPEVAATLKEQNIIKEGDLEAEKNLWELVKLAYDAKLFAQAEMYLRDLVLRHKNLQNDQNWCQILAYEVFNRVLCLARFSHGVPSGETIKEDLMMVIGVLDYWPAKYLLVMFFLTIGLIEQGEMMCEMFLKAKESTANDWTRKLEHVQSIMAVCELDPAQIPKLIPKSFEQVCVEVPFVDLTDSPATNQILSSNFHGYLSHFPGVVHERTIKGISFVGDRDQYVGVGSDGGYAFLFGDNRIPVWAAKSDTSIVNVIESHPFLPVLAVSGLDSSIKIWEPSFLSCSSSKESISDFKAYPQQEIPQLIKDLPELQGVNRIEWEFDPGALMIYLTG